MSNPETRQDERNRRSGDERRRSRELERRLILAAQGGDLEAFGDLVKRYQKRVYWIAFNLVGNAEDAEDIAQESFLRVYKALGRFKPQYNFYTWLYRIVVNLSIDFLRKRGKQQDISMEDAPLEPAAEGGPVRDMENKEIGERILEVLGCMPPKYRTMIVLRDMQGLSTDEIVRIVQCTKATARWRLHKARELFKQAWQRLGMGVPA